MSNLCGRDVLQSTNRLAVKGLTIKHDYVQSFKRC